MIPDAWYRENCYVIGICKNKSSCICRYCEDIINNDKNKWKIRIGMIYQHVNGYILLQWYHLSCFPFLFDKMNIEDFEGFELLNIELKKSLLCWYKNEKRKSLRRNSTNSISISGSTSSSSSSSSSSSLLSSPIHASTCKNIFNGINVDIDLNKSNDILCCSNDDIYKSPILTSRRKRSITSL